MFARFFILMISAASLLAQVSDPVRKQAAQAMSQKDWKSAAALYETITGAGPATASDWSQLATAYYNMNQFPKSAAAYRKLAALQPSPFVMYNLSCAYALSGRADSAWSWIEKAISSGYFLSEKVRADPDLTTLHSVRFDVLMQKVDTITRPCEFDPLARQFDFWIGSWDVYSPQGQKTGTSVIQKLTDGCMILENWEGSLGGSGKSMNFYDPQLKKWRQIWMSSRGGVSEFAGSYRDSVMDFRGENTLPDGRKAKTRLRFFFLSPEKVRQFSEQSADNEKTWQTNYDFLYIRKK